MDISFSATVRNSYSSSMIFYKWLYKVILSWKIYLLTISHFNISFIIRGFIFLFSSLSHCLIKIYFKLVSLDFYKIFTLDIIFVNLFLTWLIIIALNKIECPICELIWYVSLVLSQLWYTGSLPAYLLLYMSSLAGDKFYLLVGISGLLVSLLAEKML